jgi:uncharacterized protein (TIGR02147 family)
MGLEAEHRLATDRERSVKSIQQFATYREFLLATYGNAREGQSNLSLDRYAKKLGLGGSNFKMIVSGRRNLTGHQTLNVARALRMSPLETEYFEALVAFDQAKSAWEKSHYQRRLRRVKSEMKLKHIRVSNQSLLQDSSVLPLLVYLSETQEPGFSFDDLDCQRLARLFKLPERKMRELVTQLQQRDLIKTAGDGRLHFVYDKLANVRAQKEYLKRLLKDAENKIEAEYETTESFFTAYAFSTSDEDLAELKEDLKRMMESHMSRGRANSPGSRIAQACFQVFPVSEKLDEKAAVFSATSQTKL